MVSRLAELRMIAVSHLGNLGDRISGAVLLGDRVRAGAAEDDEIEERIGAQSVGAVDGGARGLAGSVQSLHDLVLAILVGDDL